MTRTIQTTKKKPTTKKPTTKSDEDLTVDAVWFLLPHQWTALTQDGLTVDERLRRAVLVVEELVREGEDAGEHDDDGRGGAVVPAAARVRVETALTMDEFERTWPDARTNEIDPWYGDGDVDRANAEARTWSARYLLRAVDGGR